MVTTDLKIQSPSRAIESWVFDTQTLYDIRKRHIEVTGNPIRRDDSAQLHKELVKTIHITANKRDRIKYNGKS